MTRLYVAGQNLETREWVPVAELCEDATGYALRYTKGAQRLPGFGGLSRMQDFDKVYYSRELFPFFANRLISKSRPEYKQYLRWLGLDALPSTPLEILGITGGIRATDNYELIAVPKRKGPSIALDFFPRGLRYQAPEVLAQLAELAEDSAVYLMCDVQNQKDPHALAIRSEQPHAVFIGYVPRYYAAGLSKLLSSSASSVRGRIKRVNSDAPMDMKLLLSFEADTPMGFDMMTTVEDFQPLSAVSFDSDSRGVLQRTNLDIG